MTRYDSNAIDRRTVLKLTGGGLAAGAVPGTAAADREGADPGPFGSGASSRTYEWFLTGCQASIAVVPVDSEALAPFLPEGFSPQSPAEFGLPPDPRGDAVIGVEAFYCDSGAALEGTIECVPYVSYFAPVEPPNDRADPDVRYHFVKWDVLIADDDLRNELADHGVPAEPGEVTYDSSISVASQLVIDVTGTVGDDSSRITGSGNQPGAEPETFSFLEFTQGNSGLVEWDVMVDDADMRSGTGRLEVAPGSLPATVIGSESTQAYVLAGSLSFSDATIEVPRRAEPARK